MNKTNYIVISVSVILLFAGVLGAVTPIPTQGATLTCSNGNPNPVVISVFHLVKPVSITNSPLPAGQAYNFKNVTSPTFSVPSNVAAYLTGPNGGGHYTDNYITVRAAAGTNIMTKVYDTHNIGAIQPVATPINITSLLQPYVGSQTSITLKLFDVGIVYGTTGYDLTVLDCAFPAPVYQCSDGSDNDGDGLTDFPQDPGCTDAQDNNESNQTVSYQCSDGQDNDNDNLIDYPNDPGCTNAQDTSEVNAIVCIPNVNSICQGNFVYSVDSCGEQTLTQNCNNTNQTCSNGACITTGGSGNTCGATQLLDPRVTKQGIVFSGVSNTVNSSGLNTLIFNARNTNSTSKTITIDNYQCRCPQHLGEPQSNGGSACSFYWSPTSNPTCRVVPVDTVIPAGQTRQIQTSVTQYNNQICGSTQLDFLLTKINGVPFGLNNSDRYIGSSFTDMCRDCQMPVIYQCSDGSDNDNDNLIDFPNDPGCTSATDNSEFNAVITCSANAQCGTDGFIDAPFCSSSSIISRKYRTFTCNNPGTSNSYCSSAVDTRHQATCSTSQTCSNGQCINNTPALTVSCTASPNPANVNQLVYFIPSVSGGTGSYSYSWSNATSLCDHDQICNVSYSSSGIKTTSVTVTSGNQQQSAICSVLVNEPTLNGSCTASPNPANVDQQVTFAATNVTGGSGNYTYSWTGSCAGSGSTCSTSFNSSGTKQAYLRITSGNQTKDVQCSTTVSPLPTLTASCSASPNPANINQQVTFTAMNVSGGTGNYTYAWTDECTGSGSTCQKTFTTAGTKNASLRVMSGSQTRDVQCSTVVNQPTPILTVSCTASPSQVNYNESVTFTPTVSGGSGSYSYNWSGACTGLSQNCSNSFSASGTKTATINVTSGNQTQSASCSTVVNQPSQLQVSCVASPNPANTNQAVTFIPTVSGGIGTYTYSWSGQCTGSNHSCTNTFSTAGTKSATVNVTSGNQTQSASCSTVVNQPNTLTASCSAAPNPANTNQQVTYFPTVSGGNGTYSYSWTGSCVGSAQNCSTSFNSSGTKNVSLEVTSDGQTVTTSCSTVVNQLNNLNVSCSATPNPAQTNQSVIFYPSVSGGTGNYTYNWSGACSGTSANCSNTFNNPGIQTATLVVTSGNQTQSATCQVNVNQVNNLAVSCYATPNPAQIGNQVTFNAFSSGGTGNYSYTWSGACSGSSQYCYTTASQYGQTATVNVYSNGQSASTSCSYSTNQSCVSNSYQQCVGGNVHRFNSCGVDEGVSQYCTGNQTCSGNVCINQTTTNLTLTKQVRNLSAGNLNWSNSVGATPLDILQFQVTVQSYGNQFANNVTVRDILPANLIYKNSLTLDGVASGGDITSNMSIGSIGYGQTRTITYQVQVAPAQNFAFGTTTLTNSVVASNTSLGYATSNTASASIIVTRTGVQGATDVSTGLTNNPWVDSFFLPLLLALIGLWLYKSRVIAVPAWIGTMQAKNRNALAAKKLEAKINDIKKQEVV